MRTLLHVHSDSLHNVVYESSTGIIYFGVEMFSDTSNSNAIYILTFRQSFQRWLAAYTRLIRNKGQSISLKYSLLIATFDRLTYNFLPWSIVFAKTFSVLLERAVQTKRGHIYIITRKKWVFIKTYFPAIVSRYWNVLNQDPLQWPCTKAWTYGHRTLWAH